MSDIHSDFIIRDNGAVCIRMDDPTFVRAETVLVDLNTGSVSVLLCQKLHELGDAPAKVLNALREESHVTLSAIRIDGSPLSLSSPVVVRH